MPPCGGEPRASPFTTTCTSRGTSATRSRTSGTSSTTPSCAMSRSSGRSRSPDQTPLPSHSFSPLVTFQKWPSSNASTFSSPTPRVASSTTPSSCVWRKTTSGYRSPIATCCCGPRVSPSTQAWTSKSTNPTSRRCNCRGQSRARSWKHCSAPTSTTSSTTGYAKSSSMASRSSCLAPAGQASWATSCTCEMVPVATSSGS